MNARKSRGSRRAFLQNSGVVAAGLYTGSTAGAGAESGTGARDRIESTSVSSSIPSPQMESATRRLALVSAFMRALARSSPVRPARLTAPNGPAQEAVIRAGARRAFVICSPSITRRTNTVARIGAALGDLHAGVFDAVENDATYASVRAGTDAAVAASADLLIAVGGGAGVFGSPAC